MATFQRKNLITLLLLVVLFHGFSQADDNIYEENYWWTRIQSSLKDRRGALLEFLRAAVEDKSGAVQYLLQTRGPALFYPIAKERDRDFQRLILVTLKTYDLYHLKAFYRIPEEGSDAWIAQIFQKIFFIYSQDRRFCFALRERLEKAKAWEWREGEEAFRTISLVMSAIDESLMEAEFVTIPAGTFVMGSPYFESGREGDEILHKVVLTKEFEMQTTEVTQLQWVQVMENNPSRFKEKEYCASDYTEIDGTSLCPNHPVENVSWNEVQLFISRLNERDARYHYRLPTEAEWEVAARGLKQKEWVKRLEEGEMGPAYSFGDDRRLLSEFGWFSDNSGGQTQSIAQKKPNAFRLYDMHGNVREWTLDLYTSDYSQDEGSGSSDDNLRRVIRGGSWRVEAQFCRSAYRHRGLPDYHPFHGDIGFRLVRGEK